MAQRVNIVLVDDIDGSDASETVTFGLDGATYEIDLNDEHAAALRDALATYVGHGRKVSRGSSAKRGRGGSSGSTGSTAASGASASDVRAWARENGYDVPARGRIPADVRQAFDAAN